MAAPPNSDGLLMPAHGSETDFQHVTARMAKDPEFVNSLVDSCARMLGDLLSIKNPEIDNGRVPLGKVLYDLKEHFPSRETLDLIDALSQALDFCRGCGLLCSLLDAKMLKNQVVPLHTVAIYESYYSVETFFRTRGSRRTSMRVGGIGSKISIEIEKSARLWLEECDRVMTASFGDPGSVDESSSGSGSGSGSNSGSNSASSMSLDTSPEPQHASGAPNGEGAAAPATFGEQVRAERRKRGKHLRAGDDDVADLIRNLSIALADYLSSMDGLLPVHRRLNARMLEARAAEEFARVRSSSEEDKRTDLIVLKTFEFVARFGVQGEGGKSVLDRLTPHLSHICQFPPRELFAFAPAAKMNDAGNNNGCGTGAANDVSQCINLDLLSNALDDDVDVDVRASLINHWRQLHGAHAAAAATAAITEIERWSLRDQPAFVGVLCNQVGRPQHAGMRMPPPAFLKTNVLYFKPRGGGAGFGRGLNRGLDFAGRRIVRLTSLVWELIGRGELRGGHANASLVSPVVSSSLIETRVVAAVITQKLESVSLGEKLRKFTEDVTDKETILDDEVGAAMAHMGRFSELAISSAFHHKSPVLPLLVEELTERARRELLFQLPQHYFAFATDALAIALPILKERRASLGVSPWRSSGPLADVLRTIPVVREWTPLKGNLELTFQDFRRASPLAHPMLKKLVEEKCPLVVFKRPYGGAARSKTRNAFVFDTRQLMRVLEVK